MTYYTTPRGAKVFAAGAFTLGGAALWPSVSPCSTTSGGSSARPDLDRRLVSKRLTRGAILPPSGGERGGGRRGRLTPLSVCTAGG